MATLKVYRNGVKLYQHGVGTHVRALRGEVTGWTDATARRQRDWLWGVPIEELTGYGWAVTLTVRECPASAVEWAAMRKRWIQRVEAMGATRVHWVTEWQARGVPHLHAAVYFDRELLPFRGGGDTFSRSAEELRAEWAGMLVIHWLEVVRGSGLSAEFGSQDLKPIDGASGWLKYLAKHASRGAAHYQRQGVPEGWEKSGRMWGHRGAWPSLEPIEIPGVSREDFFRIRRICRAWAVADARSAGDRRREVYLKRAGRPSTRRESSWQGIGEWIPEAVILRLVEWLGHE